MKSLLDTILSVFGGLSFLTGIGVIAFQILAWLLNGQWIKFSLLILFAFLFPELILRNSWLNNPQSWIGLHKVIVWILEMVPLSGTLIALAVFFFICIIFVELSGEEKLK